MTSSSAAEPTTILTTVTSMPKLPPNVEKLGDAPQENAAPAGGSTTDCGAIDGQTAVNQNISKVTETKWDWDPTTADLSGFDPCASLSWAVVTISHGTSSSPFQIMLFKKGEYLGTGTYKPVAFTPTVTSVDDATIAVTYHYPKPGEPNLGRSGETFATFHWDEAQQKVIMSGDTPPE